MKSCLAIIGVCFIALVIWLSLSGDSSTQYVAPPSKLELCVEKAQDDFQSFFRINSEDDDGDGVRKWKTSKAHDTAYERLDADRKLCIDLYKD